MSKFTKRIGLATVFASSLIAVCAAQQKPSASAQPKPNPPRAAMRVTAAHLAGVNIPRSAACPVKMNFAGTISASGPGEVKYTWASSDGGSWPEGTLKFTKAGSEKVGRQLEMGGGSETVHGWLQVKVLSPNAVVSNKAGYSVKCTPVHKR